MSLQLKASDFLIASRFACVAEFSDFYVAFVENSQRLFQVERFVWLMWPQLRLGVTLGDLNAAAEMLGLDGIAIARQLVDAGVIARVETEEGPVCVVARRCVSLCGVAIGLCFTGPKGLSLFEECFGKQPTTIATATHELVVVDSKRSLGIARIGGPVFWNRWTGSMPALKAHITDFFLENYTSLILHAAMVSMNGRGLALLGESGAGKSTLSFALTALGYTLESDDLTVIDANGRVEGVPFPATLKSPSWALFPNKQEEIMKQPEFMRPDGLRVRYVPLTTPRLANRSVPLQCVFVLSRSSNATASVEELSIQETFSEILVGAWAQGDGLSIDNFDSLTSCIMSAKSYRLSYSKLDAALEALSEVWHNYR